MFYDYLMKMTRTRRLFATIIIIGSMRIFGFCLSLYARLHTHRDLLHHLPATRVAAYRFCFIRTYIQLKSTEMPIKYSRTGASVYSHGNGEGKWLRIYLASSKSTEDNGNVFQLNGGDTEAGECTSTYTWCLNCIPFTTHE